MSLHPKGQGSYEYPELNWGHNVAIARNPVSIMSITPPILRPHGGRGSGGATLVLSALGNLATMLSTAGLS